jgi:hypothetical protein
MKYISKALQQKMLLTHHIHEISVCDRAENQINSLQMAALKNAIYEQKHLLRCRKSKSLIEIE